MKVLSLPQKLIRAIDTSLQDLGSSLSDSKKISEAVLRQSDYYIENPLGRTPWSEKWCQIAQLAYYLPLNFLRAQKVQNELPLSSEILDFGSGLGAGSLGLLLTKSIAKAHFVESSSEAQKLHQKICERLKISANLSWGPTLPAEIPQTLICSYSLTELETLPNFVFKAQNLLLIEPSTSQDGRRLMSWREDLLKKGFHLLAPCTHHDACPLLEESAKDWCHDRVHWEMPEWFQKIEAALPMKNRTLTLSYLVASQKQKPVRKALEGRLVGDSLVEKGKTRQLICRGPSREFLVWMHKHGDAETLYRGDLFTVPENTQKVSNELRLAPKSQ
ncbi:MAG: small ribosomal subunit Rsm22 family protein [Pseudobdellovibrionaceae bacterium]